MESTQQATNGAQQDADDMVDDTPDFLNADDAVEVQVDEDDVPMEDDEEQPQNETSAMEEQAASTPVPDMSRIRLSTHTGPVYAVASTLLDPSTRKLGVLSAGGDDKGFLHQLVVAGESSPTSVQLDYAHTDSVSCAAFNLDYVSADTTKTPRLAAVGAYDGAIVIYDPDTGSKLKKFEGPTDVEWLCFHPKGGTVLLVGSAADGTVWMYHIPMNKCLQVFVGHESAVTAGSFSPDGRWALSSSSDGTLRIWAPKTGMSKHIFRLGDGPGLTSMAVNGGSDGQLVIVGAQDGRAYVCHIGSKKIVATLRHYEPPSTMQTDDELELPSSVEAVAFASQSMNPNWCATGGIDGILKVWDLANDGQCRQICRPSEEGEIGGITKIHWHPSAPLLFSSSTNGAVRVWDARSGHNLHTLTGSAEIINDLSIQWLDEGKSAVALTASDDGNVRLFDVDVNALLGDSSI